MKTTQLPFCSFKLLDLLKEKGYNKPQLNFYFEDGVFTENVFRDTVGMDYGSPFQIEFSELIENWNDKWLTKKNGQRCFGCDKSKGYFETFSAPTIADVIIWLYKKHGIWIEVRFLEAFKTFYFELININSLEGMTSKGEKYFNSPTEAYEAAIEYALKNLI